MSEGIAIVGMAGRFPAAPSVAAFRDLLARGGDAIADLDPNQLAAEGVPETLSADPHYVPAAAVLDGIDLFDAGLFGIPSHEANLMDPQQRMLLEVSWEAFERAGIAVNTLRDSRTGVFVGLMNTDYGQILIRRGVNAIDAYAGLGAGPSVTAGRLSYVFGLQGPCMAMDTACSSSLVAVHQACLSLREGECDLALAAGVNG